MRIFSAVLLLVHALGISKIALKAKKPAWSFLAQNMFQLVLIWCPEGSVELRSTAEYGQQVDEEDYEDYYDEEEYEDGMSGDYDELPRVAMKYKDFCIHGTCQYHRNIRAPSCVCHQSYSGERCEFYTLPVEKPQEGYNRTTALAVVAVVLSSVCLTIIGLLLLLRFHKRGAYDVENEEKVKLGLASSH
ncbi:hypothetical protein JOQ06_024283 [Pogonophryne albipinna]|uniref:Proheparin-binding EGF-like growth factor n=1 Tax=Pogonophryne albipinna TaxID=1090488 RepID=A0AAD6BQW3_9TELE|nr:hypothetical protein JOQ06_024283 [Pogonophryne albipinna]